MSEPRTQLTVAELYARAFAAGWEKPPEMTTSQWADQYRRLAKGTGPDPGQWSTDRTPYLREIMDVMGPDHPCRRVVIVKGSRMGGTEALNNFIGRTVHLDRRSVIFYNPDLVTRNDAKTERIDPMFEESPALLALMRVNLRTRISFAGCQLSLVHASSIRSFRARGAPVVVCDEIDAWVPIVCSEGDKIRLAEKRASNYPRQKIVLNSSPSERDVSPIEREFNLSDQRRFFVECPHCGRWDFLTLSGYRDHVRRLDGGHYWLKWDKDQPRTARMVCGNEACQGEIPEAHKYFWLRDGQWRPTAPGDGETVGFHLPSLLAPSDWFSWGELATEFVAAHDKPDELRTFVNTRLGETFEDRALKIDVTTLSSPERLEHYGGDPAKHVEVPDGVGALIGGVDTQDDRLELVLLGFSAREEAWVIGWEQFYGDPAKPGVWQQLEQARAAPYAHASGRILRVRALAVDTMGHKTEGAYRYCKAHEDDGVYAVRGSNQAGLPIANRPSRRNRYGVNLFPICTDTAKARLFARLNIDKPGPGYIHLPDTLGDPEEFARQLVSEKGIWRRGGRGRPKREWIETYQHHEVLDCIVYALGALYILGSPFIQSLPERARAISSRREDAAAAAADPAATNVPANVREARRRLRARRSFVNRWK
jgi:phage terminase large subunit GpA-like protein